MYRNLYELVFDLTGLSVPPLRIVQSFGFFLACAFMGAAWVLYSELRRKEDLGHVPSTRERIWKDKRSSPVEWLAGSVIGFVVGYKLLALVIDFSTISLNPQDFMLSADGSVLGGVLGAAISAGLRWWEERNYGEPKEVELTIHAHEQVSNITMVAAVMGILGAKLFHNLENLEDFAADPWGSFISFSGMSYYGGLICAAAAVIWYGRSKGISAVHLSDATAPGLILAYGIGRIGCQVSGDGDWGLPNDAPMPAWLSFLPEWVWAYDYPNNVLHVNLLRDFHRMGLESVTGKAWPTPIYETIMSFMIFGFMWWKRKSWTVPGMAMSMYMLLNGIERILIEQIRINNEYNIFGFGITQAEIIATLMIIFGSIGIFWACPKYGERWAKWGSGV